MALLERIEVPEFPAFLQNGFLSFRHFSLFSQHDNI